MAFGFIPECILTKVAGSGYASPDRFLFNRNGNEELIGEKVVLLPLEFLVYAKFLLSLSLSLYICRLCIKHLQY